MLDLNEYKAETNGGNTLSRPDFRGILHWQCSSVRTVWEIRFASVPSSGRAWFREKNQVEASTFMGAERAGPCASAEDVRSGSGSGRTRDLNELRSRASGPRPANARVKVALLTHHEITKSLSNSGLMEFVL